MAVTNPVDMEIRLHPMPAVMISDARRARFWVSAAIGSGPAALASVNKATTRAIVPAPTPRVALTSGPSTPNAYDWNVSTMARTPRAANG